MRLIDADALKETMYHEAFETDTDMQKWDSGCWIRYKMFEDALENAPTIYAEPIVRCKDCRWFNDRLKRDGTEDNRYAPSICTLYGRPHSNTYFCADGEVKE